MPNSPNIGVAKNVEDENNSTKIAERPYVNVVSSDEYDGREDEQQRGNKSI